MFHTYFILISYYIVTTLKPKVFKFFLQSFPGSQVSSHLDSSQCIRTSPEQLDLQNTDNWELFLCGHLVNIYIYIRCVLKIYIYIWFAILNNISCTKILDNCHWIHLIWIALVNISYTKCKDIWQLSMVDTSQGSWTWFSFPSLVCCLEGDPRVSRMYWICFFRGAWRPSVAPLGMCPLTLRKRNDWAT